MWLRDVVDKLVWKHHVTTDEVEDLWRRALRSRCIATGDVAGEDLYAALGQTAAGRSLMVYFVSKATGEALISSAREMTHKEKRAYGKK